MKATLSRIALAWLCWTTSTTGLQAATIAFYRFESAATLTNDASGNGNVLTNSGAAFSTDVPTSWTGSTGCAYFSSSVMDTLNTLDLSSYTNLTVEWFMKPAIATTAVVWEQSPNTYSASYYGGIATFLNNGSQMNVRFNPNDYSLATIPGGTTAGAWHHYAARIRTGGYIQLYIDYQYVGQGGGGMPDPFLNEKLHLGARAGGGAPFTGYLDELRVSDRFLEPREFVGAPRTLAYWRFEPGAITNDSSGYGQNLSNSGVTTSSDTTPAARHSAGSAAFNGTAILSALSTLDLAPYTNLTVEWFMKPAMASSTAAAVPWETGNPWDAAQPGSFGAYLGNAADTNPDGILIGHRRTSGTEKMINAIPNGITAGSAWHHFAVLISATNTTATRLQMFIDRKAVGTWTMSFSPVVQSFGNYAFTIGARGGLVVPYTGLIDDMRITDGFLAPEDFLYQPPKGTMVSLL